MLSEDQVDGLLRDFFRLEAPSEFRLPARPEVSASVQLIVPRPTISQQPVRGRRAATVIALAAICMLMLVSWQVMNIGMTGSAGTAANGPQQGLPDAADDSLLVSPGGDRKSTGSVGEDGVTLDETDGVQLNPGPR
jgi:hypothetical protein